MARELEVLLFAEQVGTLALIDGRLNFRYTSEWLLRIPAKLDSNSRRSWTLIPEQAGQSERSDAGFWGFTRVMSSGSSCSASA